jgi:hypothetical protein
LGCLDIRSLAADPTAPDPRRHRFRVRLDRKATSISLLLVLGVRADGQKVLLAIKSMDGESAEAWRTVLDNFVRRGLRRPEFLIVDGAPGLDKAIAAVWDGACSTYVDDRTGAADDAFLRAERHEPVRVFGFLG